MNAQEFVNLLKDLNVLAAGTIEGLLNQSDVVSDKRTPQQLLKSLLDSGQITREQARLVVSKVRQLEAQALTADDEVIDLSQANLSGDAVADPDEEIIDLSQLGDVGDEDDEVVDLDQFGADQGQDENQVSDSSQQDRYRPEDEEEEVNWGGMMIIGNALVFGLLCVGAVVLYIVLANHSAKKTWESAFKQYAGGSYQQAKSRMDSFVEEFPNDGNVNRAKIYSIMSEVNIQLVSVRKDSVERIEAALLVGDYLEGFREEAEVDLKSLLPRLAEYYVNAARILPGLEDKREYVALTEKTLELIGKVRVLEAVRQDVAFQARLQDIRDVIAEANKLIARGEALETTLAEIDELIAADTLDDAFIARNTLIEEYAELRSNDELRKAVMKISEAEQKRVVRVEATIVPNNDPIPVPPEHKVIVATRNGKNISGVQGYFVTVLAGDSVYGIELATGRVNWRRFVGLQTNLHPIRVAEDGLSDSILVDGTRYELVRVDSSTGEQKWRLPVGGTFTQPRLFNGKIYCNTHVQRQFQFTDENGEVVEQEALVGSLLTINPDTGEVERQIQYPMGTHVEPGFDDENGIIYQVGDHSNLYAVSARTGECVGVYYLGHDDGGIAVPAVYAVGYVILIENGKSFSTLHVLSHDEDGFSLGQDAKTLQSLVRMPPQAFGRRLLVSTELGQIYVYDVDPNLPRPIGPLAVMAAVEGEYDDPIREYGMARDGLLYMGGRGLVKYQIQSQLGQLKKDWAKFQTAVFVAPIQKFGNVVVYARQKQNTTRVTISGHPVKEVNASWEVDLARTAGTAFLPSPQQGPKANVLAGQSVLVNSVGAEE